MEIKHKPHMLILITIQFSVRYIIRTGILDELQKVFKPIILLGWKDIELENELIEKGIEFFKMPETKYGERYNRVRSILNIWHAGRVKSPSIKIDRKRNRIIESKVFSLKNKVFELFFLTITKISFIKRYFLMQHEKLFWQDTNAKEVREVINLLKPDFVLSLTPFLREDQVITKVAQSCNAKLITSILSFDNITTRGWIPILFDHYFLWNEINKKELLRVYPITINKDIRVIGPVQFDFYYNSSFLWKKEKWQKELNLPLERPVILFGAGFYAIVPNEHFWLGQLDQAITDGKIKNNPIILFRIHPIDPIDRWQPILEKSKNIIYDLPWKGGEQSLAKTNISHEAIKKLCSTLKWSDVHINASSTMTIDGAIYDKPQIGPSYDDSPGKRYDTIVKQLYLREHFLPITKSGGLAIAETLEDLIYEINTALQFPQQRQSQRQKMVKEICQYNDGKSSERFIKAIKDISDIKD